MRPPLCCLCSPVPSCGPTNVSAFATTSSSILVRWFEVPEPDRNGLILGYKVCLCFLCFQFIHYLFTEPVKDLQLLLFFFLEICHCLTVYKAAEWQYGRPVLLLFLLTSIHVWCPRWIRWCTKRRTPTVQFTSGPWMGTPPTVSSWRGWGSTCSMRSRFWLSHGSEMAVLVLHPSWRGPWMMCQDLQWASYSLKCGQPRSGLFGSPRHSPMASYLVSKTQDSEFHLFYIVSSFLYWNFTRNCYQVRNT